MNPIFKSILLLIRSPSELDILLPLSARFASEAEMRVDIVDATGSEIISRSLPQQEEPIKSKGSLVYLFHESKLTRDRVLQLIAERSPELLMVCAEEFQEGQANTDSSEIQRTIEDSPIPVLLVPRSYDGNRQWKSILVPMSGEVRQNKALEFSIRIANRLGLSVDVIHVANPSEPAPAIIAKFSDDAHHELPKMIDEFLAEASPLTSTEEKTCLRDFHLCRGSTAEEILARVQQWESDLVAIQWKGVFRIGHAAILKRVLHETNSAVLLVRQDHAGHFKFKAGSNIVKPNKVA